MPSHRPDIPFPLGAFSACRALAIADATTWGAVTAIVGAWWASGCAPLPDDASGLAVLARCSPRQWRRVQAPVRAALAELLPGLAAEYARGRRMAAKRRAAASHAAKVRHGRTVRGEVRPVVDSAFLTEPAVSPGLSWSETAEAASRVRRQAPSADETKIGSASKAGRLIDTYRPLHR